MNNPKPVFVPIHRRAWDYCTDIPEQRPSDQLSIKPDTNWTQTGHKLDTKESTNRTQTGHKPNPVFSHKPQTGHKLDTELNTEGDTNRTQTGHKLDTKDRLSTIVGLQRLIINLFYFSCKKNKGSITESLTKEYIASSLNIPMGSVKTTIQRLEQKQYITRKEFKNGRGGWSKYELADPIYRDLLQHETGHKLDTNWVQTGYKPDTELNTELNTTLLSNSSYLYNKTITTNADTEHVSKEDLPIEWQNINYEKLQRIGFSETQLSQLYSRRLNIPEVVQESINHFAFGIDNTEKTKSYNDPLNVLMGVLRKGQAWVETNYESETDRALKQMLERRKQEEEKRQGLYKEFFEIEYKNWFNSISDEQLKELLPKVDLRFGRYSGEIEHQAKMLFRQTKWSEIYENIKIQTLL